LVCGGSSKEGGEEKSARGRFQKMGGSIHRSMYPIHTNSSWRSKR
jgi:hypothetical protein